jgi:hypothetical protein
MKKIILTVVCVCLLSGCAVPAILGVKSYQSGDTKIDFITGVDFGFGMNGIDTVNNNRGISQEGGYNESPEPARKNR